MQTRWNVEAHASMWPKLKELRSTDQSTQRHHAYRSDIAGFPTDSFKGLGLPEWRVGARSSLPLHNQK